MLLFCDVIKNKKYIVHILIVRKILLILNIGQNVLHVQ